MKTSTLFAAGLLAALFTGTTQAATPVIRISGAATYRPPILKGIEDILDPGYGIAYNGSARYRATASIYSGTLASNHQAIIIKTYFTGDLAGIVDLTKQNNITKWISSSVTLGTDASPVVLTSTYSTEIAPPQASVTVSFATSSAATVATAGATGASAANTILNTTLTNAGSNAGAGGAQTIGIAAFQWVVGKLASGFTLPFTNINQAQAYSLINQGSIPVAFLTGSNGADLHKYAVLVGRSEDAGARTVPFAEAQTGFGNAAYQYALTFSNNQTVQADNRQTGGAGSTVTGGDLWPANAPLNTEPTINWNSQGHSGYNLTSDLANVLSATNPVVSGSFSGGLSNLPGDLTQAYFVGYNGVADTAALVAAGGTALNYNGVPYSVSAVQNGQYSLWSFAHLYYIGAGTNQLVGVPQNAADDLADKIYITDADINTSGAHSSTTGAGIFYNSSVVVTRSLEGGGISQTY